MKETLYISLPMSGRDEQAIRTQIDKMRMEIKATHPEAEVFTPYYVAEYYNLPEDTTYGEYLAHDIAFIIDHITHVFFARDWRQSKGCRLERATAHEFDKVIIDEQEDTL